MMKKLQTSLLLTIALLCGMHFRLPAQILTPEAAKAELAGKWRVSREATLKNLDLCGECPAKERMLKELEEMTKVTLSYSAKGTMTTKLSDGKTIKGTYRLVSHPDSTRICPGFKTFGTVFRLTNYDNENPKHGDNMQIVFLDHNQICILDVGCPFTLVRTKQKK